ncbi:uncharacterized protein THITE_2121503 [Thermothielavioides terrestris NRRL 8126]|uniref:Uncharacterized protein n=1 Tax=Thermothielavioides terrestris (strain ATCC 38088 / NRRL 8126) TaxID=578455 RepID=G2REZ7_THETT|nr:uncharacterized protein THITE_2121503 [Thermothielavioides terrestris NRRL 8126]AEO70280.1 hypothetical protein THITE_2121503 [Thermothielavioides terrestris NRRL 8126]
MSATTAEGAAAQEAAAAKPLGMRKNGNLRLEVRDLRFVVLMRAPGKQWHAPKKAFRPGSGLTSYKQRAQARVAQAATKAKEKEMKEEKEAERQVRIGSRAREGDETLIIVLAEADTSAQGEAGCQGRERTVRAVGGEDAQEEAGAVETQGEAQ